MTTAMSPSRAGQVEYETEGSAGNGHRVEFQTDEGGGPGAGAGAKQSRGGYRLDEGHEEKPGYRDGSSPDRNGTSTEKSVESAQPHHYQQQRDWLAYPSTAVQDVMHGHGHSLGPPPPRLTSQSQSDQRPVPNNALDGSRDHHLPSLSHLHGRDPHMSGSKSEAARRGVDGQPVGDGDLRGYEGTGGLQGDGDRVGNGDGYKGGNSTGHGEEEERAEGLERNGQAAIRRDNSWMVELDRLDNPTMYPAESPRVNPLHYFSHQPPIPSAVSKPDPSDPSTSHPTTPPPPSSFSPALASHYDQSGRLVPPVHIAGVYKDHVVFEPGSALQMEEDARSNGTGSGKAGAFLHKVGKIFGGHGSGNGHASAVGNGLALGQGEIAEEEAAGAVKLVVDGDEEGRALDPEVPVTSPLASSGARTSPAPSDVNANRTSPSPSKAKHVFTGRGPARRPNGPPNTTGNDNDPLRRDNSAGDADPTVFRRADLDEPEEGAGVGPAPPSPPISDVIGDGEGEGEGEEIGVAYGGEAERGSLGQEYTAGRPSQEAGRHISVTGLDFVNEPEPMLSQLDPRPASPSRPIGQEARNRLSPIPMPNGGFPLPPARRASNASTLSMASSDRVGRYSNPPSDAVYLAPPILTGQTTRTGSLAIVRNASRQSSRNTQRSAAPDLVAARMSPDKNPNASRSSKAPSDIIQQRPDVFLDSPDPPIPADRADGQWTVPVSTVLNLPERASTSHQSASYTSAYQHPAGTSTMSSSSLASSLGGGGPRLARRSTAGPSPVSPGLGRVPLPHSSSSQMVPSWSGLNATAGPSGRHQTEVPGLSGQALDSDIIAQADRIREERLARRQKKRLSGEEKTFELFIPENAVGEVIPQPTSPRAEFPPGRSISGGLTRRLSRKHSELPESHSDMRPMRRMTQRDSPLPGNVDQDRVLVGNLIGEDHVNYVLMYNMLTGIRIGVSRCQAKIKRPLTEDDYTARHKFSFDIYDFKFKDYAPWVFRELREDFFHLDPADYLLSLTAKYILSELGSPGKSGSFFYFSRDYRFIIKTIHHAEHKFLRSIMKDYYDHIKNNPHTLISRFYGLHRVKLPRGKKIHFVIMNNLFPPHRDIHETYDLKGSAWHREYPEDLAKQNPKATLKDLNWYHRGRTFGLGPEKKALFSEQLKRDAEFLRRVGVMDYSLLIGIHNMERGNRDNIRENQLTMFDPEASDTLRRKVSSIKGTSEASAFRKAIRKSVPQDLTSAAEELPKADSADRRHFLFYQDEGGLRATDEANMALDVIYYLGVIDILTPYDMKKRLEHFWKGLTEDRHLISCQPPDEYADRFLRFLLSFMPGADISHRPKMDSGRPEKPKMD